MGVCCTGLTREALARFHAISNHTQAPSLLRGRVDFAIKSNEFGFVLAKPQFAIALSQFKTQSSPDRCCEKKPGAYRTPP
jgi:hypothetical protein